MEQAPMAASMPTSPVNRGKGNAILNEDKVRKHEDRLQAYGLINVNRSPAVRHGDKTLQRSLEFNTDPVPIAMNSMNPGSI